LYAWGYNNQGQLGLNSGTTFFDSPNQVGALTNWLKISGGRYFVQAIKTDGTLWAWGGNNQGQLGLGNKTYYSSPKQVGALTSWLDIATGSYHTVGIAKT
jgi:alpha-tubulin suppressor-like RCC1 family protein